MMCGMLISADDDQTPPHALVDTDVLVISGAGTAVEDGIIIIIINYNNY